ncbi:MAG TPA: flagellin [Pseudolabrys sp.]|nr:flagellin [Pseudolabrys sp.]
MSDITLSAGVRQNLLSLQNISKELQTTQNHLATGKKVNSALDNANEYFTSQGLTNRANSLSGLLDGITNGINTIQAANNGITAITKLVQSAQSLVTQAQQTSDTTVRASLATQYGQILTQIDQLAGDSGYNGTNLLSGNNLTLTLNETGTSTATVTGVTDTSTGLSIAAATSSWAGSTDIAAAATDLTAALTTLQSQSASLSSSLSTIQIRADFTSATINTLQTGAAALIAADTNEEGANLLALQTQQSLSTTALSLSAQSDRNVLKLFGG